jgi:hypothetical protein
MATLEETRSSAFRAASRALDHAIDAAIAGTPSHPSGTTFVPADLVTTGRINSYRRRGQVTIVDADGDENLRSRDHSRDIVVALIVAGVIWALIRRSGSPA